MLAKYELDYFLERAGLKRKSLFARKKTARPVELRMILEELGGTFIKLGQLLSLRPDLIPREFCDELSKLQDSVEPFSFEEVEHVIKAEFKKPIKKLFRSFEKKPVASASIGQVHVAKLKSGKKVAVKVMRPGIKTLIQTDLEILDYLARLFKHHVKQDIVDPEEIFEEFRRYTENELDYLKEAHNIKHSYDNFRKERKVKIPRVYDSLTTHRVLTMEFLEGVELRKIIMQPSKHRYFNAKKISHLVVESVMKQIFIDGFFHADPHPANILVRKNSIGLIDFGIVARLDEELREKLGFLFISLIQRNADDIVASLISLNMAESDVDAVGLKRDIRDTIGEYYDTTIDRVDVAELFFRSISVARKHSIKLPADLVLLGKALITLQGVGIMLNPGFNLIHEVHPFISKLVKQKKKPSYLLRRFARETQRFAEFVQALPDESKKIYRTVEKADFALDNINTDLQSLTKEIRVEAGRIIMGMIIAALLIGASLTYKSDSAISKLFILLAFAILIYLLVSIVMDNLRKRKP